LPMMYRRSMELYVGGVYLHGRTGANLNQTNYGGWNVSVTDYLRPSFGLTADIQGTYGRSPISGRLGLANDPLVTQHSYFIGPQLRWRKRERFASSYRVLIGGTTSSFDGDLNGQSPQTFGMYPNATKLAVKLGSTLDINLKPSVALRITPSTIFQRYNGETNRQFSISTGLVFRFGRDRHAGGRP